MQLKRNFVFLRRYVMYGFHTHLTLRTEHVDRRSSSNTKGVGFKENFTLFSQSVSLFCFEVYADFTVKPRWN